MYKIGVGCGIKRKERIVFVQDREKEKKRKKNKDHVAITQFVTVVVDFMYIISCPEYH